MKELVAQVPWQPGPLWDLPPQFQELTGWSAGGERVGRTELPEFRVPCLAGHLPLHAACRGPFPL